MPPKRSLDESSSDDDLFPDNSRQPASAPSPSGPASSGRSPLSKGPAAMPVGKAAPRPAGSPSSAAPPADDGMPPAPSEGASSATLEMLARRREMRQAGMGPRAGGPAAGRRSGPGAASPASSAPPPAGVATPQRQTSPAAALSTPVGQQQQQQQALQQTPHQPTPVAAQPAAATPHVEEVPTAPVAPPQPSAEERMREEAKALREAIATKRAAVEEAKKREEALKEQDRLDRQRHEETMRDLQVENRRIENEIMRMRDDHATALQRLRDEADAHKEEALKKVEDEVKAEYQPQIDELTAKVEAAKQRKEQLEHSLSLSSANRSIVDQAILAASLKISQRIEEEFEKRFGDDPTWEGALRDTVRDSLQASFLPQLRADEEAERSEQQRAFEDLLAFWRQAEDEERQQLSKADELLITELHTMAHRDLDALQREEIALQQAFIRAREDWAVAHRKGLEHEVEVAVERRTAEFNELRKMQEQVHAQRLAELERGHRDNLDRLQAAHDEEVRLAKEVHAERQAMQDERVQLHRRVQEEADRAAAEMNQSVTELNETIRKVDTYRTTLEHREEDLEKEREADLAAREEALREIEAIVVEQCTAADAERRELNNATAQLEAARKGLERQAEEHRSWSSQAVARLERTRNEWEREYRRWQHISEQERRATEQRFAGLTLELRQTLKTLEDEGQLLQTELASARQRGEERSTRLAADAEQMAQRREEMRARYTELATIVADLEAKSKTMSDEWQRLHLERQDLHYQRQQLESEDARVREAEDQVRVMRDAVRSSQTDAAAADERVRVAQQAAASQRAVSEAEMLVAARYQASGLAAAKENMRMDRAKTAAQVQQRVAEATSRQRHHVDPRAAVAQARTGPSLAQRLLSDMQRAVHSDADRSLRRSGAGAAGYGGGASPTPTTGSSSGRADADPRAAAGPAGTAASAAPAGGMSTSNVEVSRSTRVNPDGTHATSHWTALERLSDLETTSGSTAARP